MKRLIAILVTACMLLACCLTAVAEGPAAFDDYPRPKMVDEANCTIAFIISTIGTSEYSARAANQIKVEAAHRGYNLLMSEFANENECRDNIMSAINQGVDAIFCTALGDMEAKQDLIAMAREAGIGWYNVDCQLVDGVISNVAINNAKAGIEILYYTAQRYNWDMGIVTVQRPGLQQHEERVGALIGAVNAYPNLSMLSQEYLSTDRSQTQIECYDLAKQMITRFGDELNIFITCGDGFAVGVAEGIIAAGDPNGEKYVCSGMDGGSMAYRYIRNNTPFKFTCFQPIEYFVHTGMEVFHELQVEGLNPGDPGCTIAFPGEVIYCSTSVIDMQNCPNVGDPIHVGTWYYDAEDTEAWYNWNEGPGVYLVKEGL